MRIVTLWFFVISTAGMFAQQWGPPRSGYDAQHFTTFDVAGAGTGRSQGTIASGINAGSIITGYYLDADGKAHGL